MCHGVQDQRNEARQSLKEERAQLAESRAALAAAEAAAAAAAASASSTAAEDLAAERAARIKVLLRALSRM